jgi:hypothetical protein
METTEIPSSTASMWEPITNRADLAVLGKFGEELCEGGASIFRTIIQGLDEVEPATGKVNRQWVHDEIADIEAMIEHMKIHFSLDREQISIRKSRKFNYKAPWFTWLLGR